MAQTAHMPRWLRLTLGSLCIVLGVVGSLLPILQGWLFFLLGVLLLSRDVPLFARIEAWLKGRFPRTAAMAERIRKKIHRKGVKQAVKEELQSGNIMGFQPHSYLSARAQMLGLAGWLAVCFGAAWAGSWARPDQWYAQLQKPPFHPPDWAFPVVWTVLYALMALAAWLVWRRKGFERTEIPLGLFFVQLGLNVLWPWLFFGLRQPGLAFLDIVLLWIALLFTLASFWLENPPAGALLVPYLAWVSFAAVLNFSLWRLNT